MFVILVYDVEEKRVAKILKKCREYLTWVQNSVFEGEITEANLKKLKMELSRIIKKDADSVIIYQFNSLKYSNREVMGLDKNPQNIII
ncbi:CRISPR-associated endonuclease Cas2 [Fonticella tunisiensis]|uniref:CRISPR-associated endoribonuclease Cas2 n=1 Tax=Fonticella tunisiensis TaxID=1096341 RepID=A0A4R7KBM2_9CLOT|nr:CRISPR-associated endonuclease Cas2 [Fonticella tunisiensis]TDT51938.1 CRISPR-associated Cas2 family protein [Fonticella tunisiensis]